MENGAHDEETQRFEIALAAAYEVGRHISMIDGPIVEERRSYFYATPDDAGRFGVARLRTEIRKHDVPVLVDWNRKSEKFGLKYTLMGRSLPDSLKEYQRPEAERDWKQWRAKEHDMSRVLAEAVADALAGRSLEYLDDGSIEEIKPRQKVDPGFEI